MRNPTRSLQSNIQKIPLFFIIAVFFLLYLTTPSANGDRSSPDTILPDERPVPAEPVYGDAFVVGQIGDARTLVPILASDSPSSYIVALVFNGLLKYDKNVELIGDLAESWTIEDDGLSIVFFLRRNVKWHDGHPFTAKDVEFTYKSIIDPNVPTPYSGDFKMIKTLAVIDDYTVKITYKEPFAPGLTSWGMPIMPKHILEGQDLLTTDFARNPIGTGPYKFKRWKTGERIDLVSNHEYFRHRPYIDRYIYRVIPDTATMFLELKTGGIDEMGLTPLQFTRQTDTAFFKKRFQKFKYPSFGYTFLAYNLKDEKFMDKNVRQALNYAVDKNEIIDGVLLGQGRVCTGQFVPESWAFNKDVKPWPYDPKKAKVMLKESGWQDTDRDGWLDKNGKIFEFTILTNQGNETRRQTAEIMQRRLRDIGVKVNIRILEWSVFLNEFVNKKRFEAIILGWGLGREPDCFDIFHSSKTKEGEFNFISYSNSEIDRLLIEGRRTFDREKRKEIYNRIHEILYTDQPYMFLYIPDSLVAVDSRFQGIEVSPIGIGYNFIDWWVPKARQRYRY
ncbi:MAG: peptide-binding protein [Candidatus Omnitrophica bacterium]|nr:peptide-binding protein [Candidatus Omnitrophota bacterium]